MANRLPRLDEYSAAVQNPRTAFKDPELQAARVKTNPFGLPLVAGGGFTVVFPFEGGGQKWAVRCFHKQMSDLPARYDAISRFIAQNPRDYFVGVKYLADGIKVNSEFHPIIRMSWVEGNPINAFVERNIRQPQQFETLAQRFLEIVRDMEQMGIAHGDLQHGNIMVVGNTLKLIDYDGMFLPALSRFQSTNVGHVNFQHPARQDTDFNAQIDRFSAILIYLALRALALKPDLWAKYGAGGENLLFQQADFIHPDTSKLLAELEQLPALRHLIPPFRQICRASLASLPSLDSFLRQQSVQLVPAKHITTTLRRQYEVVRADDMRALRSRIGDRLEIVGQITNVANPQQAVNGQPYVFIDFGDWRNQCFRLVVWSAALDLFRSTNISLSSLRGIWVSVTGNIEQFKDKYGNERIQIVVELPSQIERLTGEANAAQRLAANKALAQSSASAVSQPQAPRPLPSPIGPMPSGAATIAPPPQSGHSSSPGTTQLGTALTTPRSRPGQTTPKPPTSRPTPWDNLPTQPPISSGASTPVSHTAASSTVQPSRGNSSAGAPAPILPTQSPTGHKGVTKSAAGVRATPTTPPTPSVPTGAAASSSQPGSAPMTGQTTQVSAPPPVSQICAFCAAKIKNGGKYCNNCGREIISMRFTPGQKLKKGKYTIDGALSKGGMGEVYLATAHHDTLSDKQRVIKVMLNYFDPSKPQAASAAKRRFMQEAKTLSNLSHKNIPEVFDYFEEANDACIVMESIQGFDLEQKLTRTDSQGRLRPGHPYQQEEVIGWGITLCQVLEYLAGQKSPVIHQDIKPANLLLSNDGTIYLVDFGTAATRIAQPGQASIIQTSVYGTPGYAPPEQYHGKAEPRSDVYALAATLYHLVTDDDPRLQSAAPSFQKLPDLGELGQILSTALCSDVTLRPSASTLRGKLEALHYAAQKGTVNPTQSVVIPPVPTPGPRTTSVSQSSPLSSIPVHPMRLKRKTLLWVSTVVLCVALFVAFQLLRSGSSLSPQVAVGPTVALVESVTPDKALTSVPLATNTPPTTPTVSLSATKTATLQAATTTQVVSADAPTTQPAEVSKPTATLEATSTPEPTIGLEIGNVTHGGNMRDRPGGAILGTVCPGDLVEYQYRQGEWFAIRIQRTTVDCVPDHVKVSDSGWVHQSLLSTPQGVVPTLDPTPVR